MGRKQLKLVGQDNPKLRTVCVYCGFVKKARQTGNKMMKFLLANPGLGLSANQVGILQRVCVVKLTGYPYQIMVNPKIITESKETQLSKNEGCMSIPGKRFDIYRSREIEIRWVNKSGEEKQGIFEGLDAVVIKHEIDHLNGMLLSDYKKNGKLRSKK